MSVVQRPLVALTLGDPAGIGAELVARLLALPELTQHANVVLVGDPWLWEEGQHIAGVQVAIDAFDHLAAVRGRAGPTDIVRPAFLAVDTVLPEAVHRGQAEAAGGRSALQVLDLCLDAAQTGTVDAICFAPLNKHAMKLGGLRHQDELHHCAEFLGATGYCCEINILDDLWTSRITSHVPLREVADRLSQARIEQAAALVYGALRASGVAAPKVAIAGLNPHAGDGGTCGREEINIIEPAVRALQARTWPSASPFHGPFPADTVFLKARAGEVQAVVTMYHDQGQIALKLLGFSRGVTLHGGLPVPITTPAHGTAYDIAGQGKASVEAMWQAFLIACRMGASRLAASGRAPQAGG